MLNAHQLAYNSLPGEGQDLTSIHPYRALLRTSPLDGDTLDAHSLDKG